MMLFWLFWAWHWGKSGDILTSFYPFPILPASPFSGNNGQCPIVQKYFTTYYSVILVHKKYVSFIKRLTIYVKGNIGKRRRTFRFALQFKIVYST